MVGHGASLRRFLPPVNEARSASHRIGFLPTREGVNDLPIQAPRDEWSRVNVNGVDHIQRVFELRPDHLKMLLCDIIDAQEACNHTVSIHVDGNTVTVRSTTHEFGEPTERDREIARHIDTSYNEMRSMYR